MRKKNFIRSAAAAGVVGAAALAVVASQAAVVAPGTEAAAVDRGAQLAASQQGETKTTTSKGQRAATPAPTDRAGRNAPSVNVNVSANANATANANANANANVTNPTPDDNRPGDPDGTLIQTQNGTASFVIPSDWWIDDSSGPALNHDNRYQWENEIRVGWSAQDPGLLYRDWFNDELFNADEFGAVEQRETAQGFAPTAGWSRTGDVYRPFVAILEDKDALWTQEFGLQDGGRIHSFKMEHLSEAEFASQAEVEAFLSSEDNVSAALDLMETIELYPVDQYAWPEGYDAPEDPSDEEWVEYSTSDGSASFSLPESWSIWYAPEEDQAPEGVSPLSDSSPIYFWTDGANGLFGDAASFEPWTLTADEGTIVAAEEFDDGLWAFTLATRDLDDMWLVSVVLGTVTEWADDGSIDTVEIGARGVRFAVTGPWFETRDEVNAYFETGGGRLLLDIIKSLRFSVDSEAS